MIYTEQNITTIEQPITDPLPFQIEVQHVEHSEQKITDHSRPSWILVNMELRRI